MLFKSDFYLKQNFAHLLISVNFIIFSVLNFISDKNFFRVLFVKEKLQTNK
jgi:hypothetical protein